ncbi:MAG: YerC/YecD family TrpR-related protein [Candidatus Saccharimonadales bacterium]
MSDPVNTLWQSDSTRQLVATFTRIDDEKTMQDFLRDVMTEKEIMEIAARLEAARMLRAGETYTKIIQQTKLSSRTIARISEWLQNGQGGYAAALDQPTVHHDHIPPARA